MIWNIFEFQYLVHSAVHRPTSIQQLEQKWLLLHELWIGRTNYY